MPRLLELAPNPTGPEPTVFASNTIEYMRPEEHERNLATGVVGMVNQEGPVQRADNLLKQFNDFYTLEHSERVAFGSVIVAKRLGLPLASQIMVARIAKMHDIGKADPETQPIVQSGQRLEGEARERAMRVLHKHPLTGAKLVLASDWTENVRRQVASGVAAHQYYSTLDSYGSAPHKDIEREAQIVAAVDMFDALASKRPYKDAYSLAKAGELMYMQYSGPHEVLDAMVYPLAHEIITLGRKAITLPEQRSS